MKFIILTLILFVVSCGDNPSVLVERQSVCTVTKSGGVSTVTCPDGSDVIIRDGQDGRSGADGIDGNDGQDGANGQDGSNAVILSKITVKKNSCQQVGPNIYVENIRSGEVFDVYADASCSDVVNGQLNEYCDNVQPQYGQSGSLGEGEPGSATVCWVDNVQYSGIRLTNGDLEIRALNFN